ncbi:flavocytochrome c [Lactococcus garvieae]|uniref:Fumarate reductase flavoprotein subunit n=1 Tax=Lactococcus garvieae (strain Lg2) TaxID=420890 RepID=F9VEE1_LACGL|nr:flavocytochrome c [Lactococcus garvieae]EOT33202.1 fumarate reductase flavoprotein subunit [Lactococcus garvieae ATCC 49156]EOT93241.1 fumarate reductase flavoprotein subunit [Lactococcus garvieae ATCC 49156]BAK58725.1 fumarate reductase flavoprotein subunit [Lactococcus garvieae ATCC 49156]BAK60692.1 fumarate reductase flavoprotein subunit [Lactococcus garvieae Lg2]BDW47573.1 flavocytochrome c [Lactococcus garvieae]
MKIWTKLGLLAIVGLSLTACGGNAQNKSTSSSSSEKTDAKAGVSKTMTYAEPSSLKKSYDVIIVGSGGAGMTAAIEAKDAGMNPVILEKMPMAGGNTSKASAGLNASETSVEKAQGITDSNDKFYEETLKGGGGTNDKELLRYFVDHSAAAVDWLAQNDIVLDNLTTTGGMSVSRTHRPHDGSAVGAYLVKGLEENISKRDIPVFVNSDVTKINEKDGKVSGVEVKIEGETKQVDSKAVVVTTGGFGANQKMIAKYRPDLKDYVTTNAAGSTGDGIEMISALGGALVDMDKIQIHPTVFQKTGYLVSESIRGEGAILVNKEGKRFFNEMDTRDKVSAAELKQDGKYAYAIFGEGTKDKVKAVDQYISKDMVVEADNVEELAKKLDIKPEELNATVTKWNKAVADKKDSEFGRTTGMTNDISGKVYAIKVAPGIHHTMAGVKINTQTQVLKEDGQPIKGLYAAGEVTGGLHGGNRIGGNAVADIIIFGRQAGQESAKYAKA